MEENILLSFDDIELEEDDLINESFSIDNLEELCKKFKSNLSSLYQVSSVNNNKFTITPNNGKQSDFVEVSLYGKYIRAIAHINKDSKYITKHDISKIAYEKIMSALKSLYGNFKFVTESYSPFELKNSKGMRLSRFGGIIQEADENETTEDSSNDEENNDSDDMEEIDFSDFDFDDSSESDNNEDVVKPSEEDDSSSLGEDIDIGSDNTSEQNEYDPKEIETLNKLIASEAQAISEYFDAAKNTKIPIISKVCSDIGDEERFHFEQLSVAKAQLTGEKYEPRDLDVKREYEELLSIGMDSESAMVTAMDKRSISSDNPDEDAEEASEELGDSIETLEYAFTTFDMYTAILETPNRVNINRCNRILVESYFMEAVTTNDSNSKVKMPIDSNPFVLIGKLIKSIFKGLKNLTGKFRKWQEKTYLKSKQKKDWIKRYGIKSLFSSGIHLYFYDDSKPDLDMQKVFYQLLDRVDAALHAVCKAYSIDIGSRTNFNIGTQFSFGSAAQGIQALKNINLMKTKVIVNDKNQAALERKFFGETEQKFENQKGNKVSASTYNIFDNCLTVANQFLESKINVVAQYIENMPSDENSLYNKNPKSYSELCSQMKVITETTEKIIKAVTNDLSEYVKVNNACTKEATEEADNAVNGNNNSEDSFDSDNQDTTDQTDESETDTTDQTQQTQTQPVQNQNNEQQTQTQNQPVQNQNNEQQTQTQTQQPAQQERTSLTPEEDAWVEKFVKLVDIDKNEARQIYNVGPVAYAQSLYNSLLKSDKFNDKKKETAFNKKRDKLNKIIKMYYAKSGVKDIPNYKHMSKNK